MILNVLIFLACVFAVVLCGCRLKHTGPEAKGRVIARYVMWGTLAAFAGLCGLTGWFAASALTLSVALLGDMFILLPDWKDGLPEHAKK